MLSQPLTTEDGFLNEACINELTAAILNMPPTYIRLAGDSEWNTPRITDWRQILGYFTCWAVRQIEPPDNTPYPPGLEKMIGYLAACTRNRFDSLGWADLSLCDINKMLHDILMPEAVFLAWNDAAVLSGWLDLDALLHNVCISIRDERRDFDAFNARCSDDC